jgi:hypothetical protein
MITIDGKPVPHIVRGAHLLADPVHYHGCPECYEKKPCTMDCTIEPDLEDNGRQFGAYVCCEDCSYGVICPTHGRTTISGESYRYQLSRANARWQCWCGAVAEWDDEHEERKQERAMHLHLKNRRPMRPMTSTTLPRLILAPLFSSTTSEAFGACPRCGVCMRFDIRGGCCTVCSRPLVKL